MLKKMSAVFAMFIAFFKREDAYARTAAQHAKNAADSAFGRACAAEKTIAGALWNTEARIATDVKAAVSALERRIVALEAENAKLRAKLYKKKAPAKK